MWTKFYEIQKKVILKIFLKLHIFENKIKYSNGLQFTRTIANCELTKIQH